jgi:hypothetical protein
LLTADIIRDVRIQKNGVVHGATSVGTRARAIFESKWLATLTPEICVAPAI